MAFDDEPIIDRCSEISEKSITEVKNWFSRRNGFLSHIIDGTDDYGVDIDCHVINDGKAKSFQFPIQVKSSSYFEEKIIEGDKYKLLSFNTSRLGYLIRFKPHVGIIVIYDDSENNCYYEFAYKVYNQIRQQKKNNKWLKQTSVTIAIPCKNILSSSRLKELHTQLENFNTQHNALIEEHGYKYNLPNIMGLNPVQIIQQYGELMLSSKHVFELRSLLDKLEKSILKEPYFSYIAALTYAEVGDILEADYFFRIVKRHLSNYTQNQRENLEFQEYKYKFHSGEYSRSELRSQLLKMEGTITNNSRKLQLEIALYQEDVHDSLLKSEIDWQLIERFKILVKKIEEIKDLNFNRNLQLLSSCEAISHYLTYLLTKELVNSQIREVIGNTSVSEKSRRIFLKVRDCINLCHEYITNSIMEAEKKEDHILLSHSNYSFAVLHFGNFYAYFVASIQWENREELMTFFEELLSRAIAAYNGFTKLHLEPLAYSAIHLSWEIHLLASKWANADLTSIMPIEKILEKKERFISSDFKKGKGSIVLTTFDEKKKIFGKSSFTEFQEFNNYQIEKMAELVLQNMNLPLDRLPKIIKEIKDQTRFYKEVKKENLILFSNQSNLGSDAYCSDSTYAVFIKGTDILLDEDSNIERIIKKLK